MICTACHGECSSDPDSPTYCTICEGCGRLCDKCGEPALLDAASMHHLCLEHLVDRKIEREAILCLAVVVTIIALGALIYFYRP